MTDRRKIFAILYYGGLALVLALILLQLLDDVVGKRLATHISHNSEAYLVALVLSAWIQYARPRLAGRRAEWPHRPLVGVVMLVIGIVLVQTHLPSRFRTLDEAFVALAILIPYVQARRPVSRVLFVWAARGGAVAGARHRRPRSGPRPGRERGHADPRFRSVSTSSTAASSSPTRSPLSAPGGAGTRRWC